MLIRNQCIPIGQIHNRHPGNLAALVAQAINPVTTPHKVAQPPLNVDIGGIGDITECEGLWHENE